MFVIFFIIIGLSVLILIHELGHFLAAKYFNLLVEEFGIGFPPRFFYRKIKDTIFSLNVIPLGGFVRIYGENNGLGGDIKQPKKSFTHQSAGRRAIIIGAGVVMNFLLGWFLLSLVLFIGSPSVIIIGQVSPDSPAFLSGLSKGDKIIGFEKIDDFIAFVDNNKGEEIMLEIENGGQKRFVKITPRINGGDEGALGVALQMVGVPRQDFLKAVGLGLAASLNIIGAIFIGLYQVFLAPQQIIGPVGIFDIALTTGDLGLIYLFQFLALISLNLSVLNILPIPALDGGRLFFILIEKIRGRRLSINAEAKANAVGFAILLALIALVTIKDVASLF